MRNSMSIRLNFKSSTGAVIDINRQSGMLGPGPSSIMVDKTKVKHKISDMLKDRRVKINLFCSILVWLFSSFNFYLITFYLKYFPGNIYVNSICFASADFVAFMMSGVVLKFLKIRHGLSFAYTLSMVAGITYLFNY